MAPEFVDFDAARAERADEPLLVVKVGGREISVSRPPAAAVFDMLRIQRDRSELEKLPPAEQNAKVMSIFEGLFGGALVDLEAAGASNAELNELAGRVCGLAMAEASPPNRSTRRAQKRRSRSTSSPGGRCSRPTSSASTGSTSTSV